MCKGPEVESSSCVGEKRKTKPEGQLTGREGTQRWVEMREASGASSARLVCRSQVEFFLGAPLRTLDALH